MDNVIEIIKTTGAFLGPLLGMIALLLQRASENRQTKVSAETSISSDARQWAEDFREEMRLVKEESTKARIEAANAQKDSIDCRLQLITAERSINTLKGEIKKLADENGQLTATLGLMQERNTALEAEMKALASQNVELRKEVVTLQQENSELRGTVERQALQIEQLQNGARGKEVQ